MSKPIGCQCHRKSDLSIHLDKHCKWKTWLHKMVTKVSCPGCIRSRQTAHGFRPCSAGSRRSFKKRARTVGVPDCKGNDDFAGSSNSTACNGASCGQTASKPFRRPVKPDLDRIWFQRVELFCVMSTAECVRRSRVTAVENAQRNIRIPSEGAHMKLSNTVYVFSSPVTELITRSSVRPSGDNRSQDWEWAGEVGMSFRILVEDGTEPVVDSDTSSSLRPSIKSYSSPTEICVGMSNQYSVLKLSRSV